MRSWRFDEVDLIGEAEDWTKFPFPLEEGEKIDVLPPFGTLRYQGPDGYSIWSWVRGLFLGLDGCWYVRSHLDPDVSFRWSDVLMNLRMTASWEVL